MLDQELPKIAITMGYAAGIGPELLVKSLSNDKVRKQCRIVIFGDLGVLKKAAEISHLSIKWNIIQSIKEAKFENEIFDLIDFKNVPIEDIRWGEVIPSIGKASGEYIEEAWKAAAEERIDGIVSGVLSKEALNKGGYKCQDELELFSKITKISNPYLVGVTGDVWTIPVTTHIPFRMIPVNITKNNIQSHIEAINGLMCRYGFEKPRIAVAALNVHAGEDGLYGNEEIEVIKPAILETQKRGINVTGPYPADSIFIRSKKGEFDAIVGMYHDQVNIGRKLMGEMMGVTLFVGLPKPCGTPAHGTAFDIAGKGVADNSSMTRTIEMISRLATINLTNNNFFQKNS